MLRSTNWRRLIGPWFSTARHVPAPALPSRQCSFLPRVEALESRLTPSHADSGATTEASTPSAPPVSGRHSFAEIAAFIALAGNAGSAGFNRSNGGATLISLLLSLGPLPSVTVG